MSTPNGVAIDGATGTPANVAQAMSKSSASKPTYQFRQRPASSAHNDPIPLVTIVRPPALVVTDRVGPRRQWLSLRCTHGRALSTRPREDANPRAP